MLARSSLLRRFTVLAIESSADDTCVAVVNSSRKILANVVIKQNDVHEVYGGINPKYAIDSHQSNMPFAVQRALKESGLDLVKDIDGVAFTRGPGMPGCLSVGMNAAKSLAAALNKPLVGVHHMQGHALTPILTSEPGTITFPFISLLVSGGHTLLLLATANDSFKVLATTKDESVGRVVDKVSKLLQIKWTSLGPGHALEKFCSEELQGEPPTLSPISPPIPGELEFSYSGLHSQIQRLMQSAGGIENMDLVTKQAIARTFQTAAFSQLEEKLGLGLQWCRSKGINVQQVVISGGVASNLYLRQRLQTCLATHSSEGSISLVCPPPHLCTDNAVMIAWASMHRFLNGDTDPYDIGLRPKWSIEEI